MSTFELVLQDARHRESFSGLAAFAGTDASGSFSIWPRHAWFMTVLGLGLARFRFAGQEGWRYLALPGGLLEFRDNRLLVSCRRYLLGDDCDRLEADLRAQLAAEETDLCSLRRNLLRMEDEVLGQLFALDRGVDKRR